MRKPDKIRMPRITGMDNDFMYLSCPSFSNNEIEYDIAIDKRMGTIECNCMDSVCRHKIDLITSKTPRVCKHCRLALRIAKLIGD